MDDKQEGSLSIVKREAHLAVKNLSASFLFALHISHFTFHEIRCSGSLWGLVDSLLRRVAHEFGIVLEMELFKMTAR
jgi:hypothetical protein